MKTKSEILAMVDALPWNDETEWRKVDDALLERAEALKGKPEAQMEWLLAHALDMRRRAARDLLDALRADETVAGQLRAAIDLRTGVRADDGLSPHHQSRVPAQREALAIRGQVLANVVGTYKAMAVESVSDAKGAPTDRLKAIEAHAAMLDGKAADARERCLPMTAVRYAGRAEGIREALAMLRD